MTLIFHKLDLRKFPLDQRNIRIQNGSSALLDIDKTAISEELNYQVEITKISWKTLKTTQLSIREYAVFFILNYIFLLLKILKIRKNFISPSIAVVSKASSAIASYLIVPKLSLYSFLLEDDVLIIDISISGCVFNVDCLKALIRSLTSYKIHFVWFAFEHTDYELKKFFYVLNNEPIGIGTKTLKWSIPIYTIRILNIEENPTSDETPNDEKTHYDDIYESDKTVSNEFLRETIFCESSEKFTSQLFELATGANVIEIGCGTGHHSIAAASVSKNVIGVDISHYAISKANDRLKMNSSLTNCSFLCGAVESELDKSPGEFSLVIDYESLASFNFPQLLKSLLIGLSKDGTFLCRETLCSNPIYKINRWIGYKLGRRSRSELSNAFSMTQIEDIRFAFEQVSISYFHFIAPFFAFVKYLPKHSQSRILSIVEKIDSKILSVNALKWMAFKCVIVASHPKKDFLQIFEKSKT